jgi:hypothetical protein
MPRPHVVVSSLGASRNKRAYSQQLEMMQSGKVLTGENRGLGWVDTTGESVKRAKARLVELESLLTEKGSSTISNRDR